jgi:hypothetical protein
MTEDERQVVKQRAEHRFREIKEEQERRRQRKRWRPSEPNCPRDDAFLRRPPPRLCEAECATK